MSKISKNLDMYAVVKSLLMQQNEMDEISKMRSFMLRMKEMGHDGKLTLSEVRKFADSLSYEFILNLLTQDELALQIISEESIAKLAEKMQELFLKTSTVGKRRAML